MADYDLRDLMLEAQAEVQDVMREVMQGLAEPIMMEQIVMQWHSLPDEMKERFKMDRPQEYAQLMEMMK